MRKSPAFLISLALHAVLICFLFLNMSQSSPPLIVNKGEKIVHATAIESTQLEAIEKQLKETKVQQQQADVAKQKQIEDQAKQAEAKRVAEQKAVIAAKQKQIDDAKAVAVLKEQQIAEQDRLTKLKEKQKIEAEQLAKQLKVTKAKEEEAAKKLADQKAADAEKLKKQKADEALKLKQKQQYDAAAALQKQIAAKQAAIAQQRSEAINGVVDQYKGLILEAISKNWLVPQGTNPSLATQLVITLGTAGKVTNVQVVKGSGNALLDQSAVAAVYKASPLPMPPDADAAAMFKQFSLTLKPEQFLDT